MQRIATRLPGCSRCCLPQDELRRAGVESQQLLTRMGVMATTVKAAGKWRKKVAEKVGQKPQTPTANIAIETLEGMGQTERFQAVQALCGTLTDDEVRRASRGTPALAFLSCVRDSHHSRILTLTRWS